MFYFLESKNKHLFLNSCWYNSHFCLLSPRESKQKLFFKELLHAFPYGLCRPLQGGNQNLSASKSEKYAGQAPSGLFIKGRRATTVLARVHTPLLHSFSKDSSRKDFFLSKRQKESKESLVTKNTIKVEQEKKMLISSTPETSLKNPVSSFHSKSIESISFSIGDSLQIGKENVFPYDTENASLTSVGQEYKQDSISQGYKTGNDFLGEEQRKKKKTQKNYTSYSKLSEIKLITIGIASPLRILQWAEKTLPNGKIYGEVLNANTLHHKTFKPQKGGLFCERIFGPLKDFECACGKIDKSVKKSQIYSSKTNETFSALNKKGLQSLKEGETVQTEKTGMLIGQNEVYSRKFCPDCDVEYTWSVLRRYQLGYIKLSSPVTHIWFLKGTPSYLSLLLDMKKRYLQFVTYCSETLTIEKSSLPFYTNNDSFLGTSSSFLNKKESFSLRESKDQLARVPQGGFSSRRKNNTLFAQEEKESFLKNLPIFSEKKRMIKTKRKLIKPVCKKGWALHTLKNKQQGITVKQGSKVLSTLLLNIYYRSFSKFNSDFFLHFSLGLSPSGFSLGLMPTPSAFACFSLRESKPKLAQGMESNVFLSFTKHRLVREKAYNSYNNQRSKPTSTSQFVLYPIKGNYVDRQKTEDMFGGKDMFGGGVTGRALSSPKRVSFAKKLPLDLYILCSLESFLHKSSILLSINKTWENLYKQAFLKTIHKAKLILNKFLFLNQKNFEEENQERASSLKSIDFNEISQRGEIREGEFDFFMLVKNSNFVLQKVKMKYNSHILKSLQTLKNPNFSLNYTTQFFKRNSFIELENQISTEMEKYLIKNTEYIQQSLTESFLNSLVIDQLLTLYNQKSLNLKKLVHFSKKEDSLALGVKETEKTQLKKVLNSYKNYLSLNNVNLLGRTMFKKSVYSHMQLSIPTFAYAKPMLASRRGLFPSAYAYPFGQGTQEKQEEKQQDSWLKKDEKNMEFKISKKKMYNNVYTLSHRERWDNDKEWQFFTLYSFGVKEYTDYPIYTYKNRLSSFMHSEDFSYLETDFSLVSGGKKESFVVQKESPTAQKGSSNLKTFALAKGEVEVRQSSSFYSGAGIVQQLLNEFDFYEIKKLDKQNRLLLYQINKDIFKFKKKVQTSVYNKKQQTELRELCKKRDLLIRRTKLVRKLFRKNTNPASMILTVIPVLPPDLRPIVKMGNQIAASDLNRLYQRVIYRNDRLKKFLKDPATSQSYEMKYAQRLLQEAVDNLMQNGKSGPNSEKDGRGRALKSLSDILKGKQGRFRQFLLGKRVDYSGRSVIVVGPKLKLYECGLPVEMAKELYLPFLLKRILNKNYAKTVVGAKTLIQKNPSLANELLREIMQVSPVLLNRAPTLHRLGIQAFIPKLIEGRAILLHPLVCSAFNADFDGDQMAVHVPITIEARAEAWKMMLSRNNIFSPATGDPLAIPSQDMVLGCYYLTTFSNKSIHKTKNLAGSGMYFKNLDQVIKLYEQQLIDIHALVWVKYGDAYPINLKDKNQNYEIPKSFVSLQNKMLQKSSVAQLQSLELIENENNQEDLFEVRISPFGQWQEITSNSHKLYDVNHTLISQYMCTTPGRILFNLIIQKTINKEF